jgi:peroxin-6
MVVLQSHHSTKQAVILPPSRPQPVTNGGFGDDDEADDTSDDAFYSPAKDRSEPCTTSPPDKDTTDNLDSELSSTDRGDLSDKEDIVSLSAPMLPPQSSGVLYSFRSVTPQPFNYRTKDTATPSSVNLSFTATTTRSPTATKSKVSKAQGLLQSIPDELVHPKSGGEDDEEARVIVDINTLVKIGCFSGDWAKIKATEEPSSNPLWALGAFEGAIDDDDQDWRPVREFGLGLPESM